MFIMFVFILNLIIFGCDAGRLPDNTQKLEAEFFTRHQADAAGSNTIPSRLLSYTGKSANKMNYVCSTVLDRPTVGASFNRFMINIKNPASHLRNIRAVVLICPGTPVAYIRESAVPEKKTTFYIFKDAANEGTILFDYQTEIEESFQ